ncbi:TIGR02391 family protein [Rheinheimera oceanensis]|uniref:TIGR02391 family protein n=1 Tax=Rheinheimera oceanensis TaxID=2817449 RepID=UPI001BFE1D35|nr:TIGR02391 family protein [Rheinheimera oceanensis]
MNLETRLPDSLWEAVCSNYEKRNFTGAVLDAFYFLSELLRNKSGIEGDGQALIGQALGGAAPKIKLYRLRTESEQNIQKGMDCPEIARLPLSLKPY